MLFILDSVLSTKQYLHVSLVSNDRKMCEVSGEKV